MVYAQIKDGIVQNTIVLDDPSLEGVFSQGYDYFLRVDNLDSQPGVGWSYDGQNFTAPAD